MHDWGKPTGRVLSYQVTHFRPRQSDMRARPAGPTSGRPDPSDNKEHADRHPVTVLDAGSL